jgi:hypothetical protein
MQSTHSSAYGWRGFRRIEPAARDLASLEFDWNWHIAAVRSPAEDVRSSLSTGHASVRCPEPSERASGDNVRDKRRDPTKFLKTRDLAGPSLRR